MTDQQIQLTRQGCIFPKQSLSIDIERRIRRELRVTPLTSSAAPFPTSFDVYVETPTAIVTPLFWGQDLCLREKLPLTDTRTKGASIPNMLFHGSLRAQFQQPAAAEATLTSLQTTGGAVLCLPTGYGKTTTALHIASQIQRKTVVLVHKTFLADQWLERIKSHLPGISATRYSGSKKDSSGDIVVATIQTVLSSGSQALQTADVVIIDEVHRIAAPAFSKVTSKGFLAAPYILGLSATPDRSDKLTCILHWICGPLAFRIAPRFAAPVHVRVRYSPYTVDIPLNRRGEPDHASMLTHLAEHPQRTSFLIAEMKACIAKDADCLVLSHRRAHCQTLARRLCGEGYDAQTYLGGDKTVPTSKIIVSTYGLVSEGFDEPRLNALVLATPASVVQQVVGRILRGSSQHPKLILDVVDPNPIGYAQFQKRKACYRANNFCMQGATGAGAAASAQRLLFRD